MPTARRPGRVALERIAAEHPQLLNPLVAFFVMGWQRVFARTTPLHGLDQDGHARLVPDYLGMLGLDECVHLVLMAPEERHDGDDVLSAWCLAAGWESKRKEEQG